MERQVMAVVNTVILASMVAAISNLFIHSWLFMVMLSTLVLLGVWEYAGKNTRK